MEIILPATGTAKDNERFHPVQVLAQAEILILDSLFSGTPSRIAMADTWTHFAFCPKGCATSKEAGKIDSLQGPSPEILTPTLSGYIWIEDAHFESFRAPGKLPR